MDLGQRKMTEVKADLTLEFFHDFFNHFMRFCTILILIFSKFHEGNRRGVWTYKYVPWFNNFNDLLLKSHDIYSFKFFLIVYNSFPWGKLYKKPPGQTNWQEAAKNRYFN